MNEREFINKIGLLKEIKADAKWASLVRDEILDGKKLFSLQDNFAGFVFKTRAFVVAATLILLGGFFLYSHFLISSEQKLAEELEKLSKQNKAQMLSVALADLKEARAEMDQDFADLIVARPKEEIVKIAKEIAPLVLEIEEKEGAIMGSLGIITEPEKVSTSEKVASYLIADLENRSLIEEDKVLLESAKEAFMVGDHQEALRKLLQIGSDQEEMKNN